MMEKQYSIIAEAARSLATAIPVDMIHSLVDVINGCVPFDWNTVRSRAGGLPNSHSRIAASEFLDRWKEEAATLSPEAVSLALITAAHTEKAHKESQSVELVWTGPDVGAVPVRRTKQAVLQVLDSAERSITLVSYAIYNIPHVRQALVSAAGKGVRIRMIVDTPDRGASEKEYNNLIAVGGDVASCASLYYWPHEKREKTVGGTTGKLHVKCVAADSEWLFLSSANLTEHAFTINMELGLLIQGGQLPKQIEQHFDRLIAKKVLVKV
jgi:phosphatidylserine/phosphatidylglycerophosphate/cardiolipin synthase-like enzyme